MNLLVCLGCLTAETTEMHFLIVQKLGIQDQGVGGFLLRSLSLACRQPPCCCVLTWSFLCECIPPVSECSNFLFLQEDSSYATGAYPKNLSLP